MTKCLILIRGVKLLNILLPPFCENRVIMCHVYLVLCTVFLSVCLLCLEMISVKTVTEDFVMTTYWVSGLEKRTVY